MGRRRPFGMRVLLALSVLVAALAAAPFPRSTTGLADDLAFIPADSQSFASIHLSRILKRLRLSPTRPKSNFLGQMQKHLGLNLASVERLSSIDPVGDEGTVLVVLTSEPVGKKKLLGALVPGAKQQTLHGKVIYAGDKMACAVHFARPNLVLIGDKREALARVLKKRGPKGVKRPRGFDEALADAAVHDATAWGKLPPAKDAGEIERLIGCKSGKVWVDFAANVRVNAEAYFRDSASAREMSKLVPAGLDMGRCATLYGSAMSVIVPASLRISEPDNKTLTAPQLQALTRLGDLCRKAEQGFSHAKASTARATLRVDFTFPLSTHDVRSALSCARTFFPSNTVEWDAEGFSPIWPKRSWSEQHYPCPIPPPLVTTAAEQTLPSPRYLEHPPQYIPPTPGSPADLAAKVEQPKVQVPPVKTHKLTVANVRTETALLCTTNANGKLTFSAKLGGGDAVDLTTSPGQRWAAVFSQSQEVVNFTAGDKEEIWLIRRPVYPPLQSQMPTTSPANPQTSTPK